MNQQMEDEVKLFCDNIYLLRKKQYLSQNEMAKKLGIGVYSLRKLERGELPPRLDSRILWYIYEEFHVLPHQMFKKQDL